MNNPKKQDKAGKFAKVQTPEALAFIQGASTVTKPAMPTAVNAAPEPALAIQHVQSAPEPVKTPPAPEKQPQRSKKLAPWEIASDDVKPKGLNFPMAGKLYAKMLWLTENLPKTSFQKLVLEGTTQYVDKLIAEHYEPDDEHE